MFITKICFNYAIFSLFTLNITLKILVLEGYFNNEHFILFWIDYQKCKKYFESLIHIYYYGQSRIEIKRKINLQSFLSFQELNIWMIFITPLGTTGHLILLHYQTFHLQLEIVLLVIFLNMEFVKVLKY